jgi:hypothetical protein
LGGHCPEIGWALLCEGTAGFNRRHAWKQLQLSHLRPCR